jgi:hypothetical protein
MAFWFTRPESFLEHTQNSGVMFQGDHKVQDEVRAQREAAQAITEPEIL